MERVTRRDGRPIQKSRGTAPASTESVLPVDLPTLPKSSELPTEVYHVVLSLSLDGKEESPPFQLSIGVPTFRVGRGIFQVASAYILNIASLDRLSGDSRE